MTNRENVPESDTWEIGPATPQELGALLQHVADLAMVNQIDPIPNVEAVEDTYFYMFPISPLALQAIPRFKGWASGMVQYETGADDPETGEAISCPAVMIQLFNDTATALATNIEEKTITIYDAGNADPFVVHDDIEVDLPDGEQGQVLKVTNKLETEEISDLWALIDASC